MTTHQTFEIINDNVGCKLTLENGEELLIPFRGDGYIYVTPIAIKMNRKVSHWLRLKETEELEAKILERSSVTSCIEIRKGGSDKHNQGTWIHPDLAFNFLQWCCNDFSIQVSKWILELLSYGNVVIGEEKSDEDKYKELLSKYEHMKETLQTTQKEHEKDRKKLEELTIRHTTLKSRKERYKLKKGPCVYIIDMKNKDEVERFKIGQTSDMNSRMSVYRTSNPFSEVVTVIYCEKNILLENIIKTRYEEYLQPKNSEFIYGFSRQTLLNGVLDLAETLKLKYTVESGEELNKFNCVEQVKNDEENDEDDQVKDDQVKDIEKKRCPGSCHILEEDRLLPVDKFAKNKNKKDGYASICKECYQTYKYGDDRKRRKTITTLVEYDKTTHKVCFRCEIVKEYKDFNVRKASKDGHHCYCRECYAEIKRLDKEKKKLNVEEQEEKEQAEVLNMDKITELMKSKKRDLKKLLDARGIKSNHNMTKTHMINLLANL